MSNKILRTNFDVSKLKLKNCIRLLIGLHSYYFPKVKRHKEYLSCNLIGGRVYGGPDRFLRNLLSSSDIKDQIHVSNWSLKFCRSALVFSSSWGNSFTRLCHFFDVKSVLRVDGFYVPDDIIEAKFHLSLSYRKYVNQRLSRDLKSFEHVIYQSQFAKKNM